LNNVNTSVKRKIIYTIKNHNKDKEKIKEVISTNASKGFAFFLIKNNFDLLILNATYHHIKENNFNFAQPGPQIVTCQLCQYLNRTSTMNGFYPSHKFGYLISPEE